MRRRIDIGGELPHGKFGVEGNEVDPLVSGVLTGELRDSKAANVP